VGLAALKRAEERGARSPHALQAAIAACHARARAAEEPTGVAVAALYDALAQLVPSGRGAEPTVAVSMVFGPARVSEIIDGLTSEPALAELHLLPSVRGIARQAGRLDEARAEFKRAHP